MPIVTGISHGLITANGTSLGFAHTTTTDPLIVAVHLQSNTATITALTHGAAALTRIARLVIGSRAHEWWALAAPVAAAATLTITTDLSTTMCAAARNVSGVDTAALFGQTPIGTSGTSAAPSVAVPSVAGALVLDLVANSTANQTFTPGAGQTLDFAQTGATTHARAAGSAEAGAASVTMSWTLGSSSTWTISGLSVPAVGAVTSAQLSHLPLEVLIRPSTPIAARLSYLPLEVLVLPSTPIAARLSHLPIEVIHAPGVAPLQARLSHAPLEVLRGPLLSVTAAQLSQLPIEILTPTDPSEDLAVTQLVIEPAWQQPGDLQATQLVVEVTHHQLGSSLPVTQLAVELARDARGAPGVLQTTQLLVEVIRLNPNRLPPVPRPPRTSACPPDFPTD